MGPFFAWLRSSLYWPPPGGPGRKLLAPAIALAAVLLVLGAGLIAWEYREDRDAIIDETSAEARRAAHEADRIIEERLNLLRAIAAGPGLRENGVEKGRQYLAGLNARSLGFGAGIAYLDADGVMHAVTPLAGWDPDLPADLSDRPFIQEALETGEPVVGAAFVGDFCPPVLPLVAPVLDVEGGAGGLIVGFLLLEATSGHDLLFAPTTPMTIVDRSGQAIMHDGRTMHPVDVSSEPLLAEMRSGGGGGGVHVNVSGLLGEPGQLVGFAEAPSARWLVMVTRPANEAFASALRPRLLQLGALMVALMVALVVAGETARHLDRAADRERRALASEQTAREVAEEALHTREQAIGEVVHDLRSPLTGIYGFARYLRKKTEAADSVDASLVHGRVLDIEEAAARMNSMLEDLLDAARLNAGRDLVLDPRPGDLVEVLRQAIDDEQRKTATHGIRLVAPDPIEGEWDVPRLRRVFANLLSNAVKFSPGGGEILVTASMDVTPSARLASVLVRDHGIGIQPNDLPHVFKRFARGSNATAVNGTGLGLSGALHIVELHGGTIDVVSRPGEGSIFSVRLPLPDTAEPAALGTTVGVGRA